MATNSLRSDLIGEAKADCTRCGGVGLGARGHACRYIDRAVFRACLERFRQCVAGVNHCPPVSWEHTGSGPDGYTCYGRKNEEYTADFCLVSARTLTGPLESAVFRYHFLLGAGWKACCARLGCDRGHFFHTVYRIERKLGHAFRTLTPYPLYPLASYFQGTVRGARTTAILAAEQPQRQTLRAPLVA